MSFRRHGRSDSRGGQAPETETAQPAESDELIADLEEAMRDVVDPELGINVVDLGLVYGLNVEKGDDRRRWR